jgi:hypothetical protein
VDETEEEKAAAIREKRGEQVQEGEMKHEWNDQEEEKDGKNDESNKWRSL